MMLHQDSAVGDTFDLTFEIDYIDEQGCIARDVTKRPITVLQHGRYARLCFIDILTGNVVNAWYVGMDIEDTNIMYDYFDSDFEGITMRASSVVIFPKEQESGVLYLIMTTDVRFYGYKHWTLEVPPRCFYVGKGVKKRSRAAGKDRGHKWQAISGRLGLRIEDCMGPVTNEEACAWEKENIKLMGTRTYSHHHNDDNDIGCNFTDGGDGTPGRIKSHKERAKLSIARKGRKVTKETCANMAKSARARPPISDEQRANMCAAQKARPPITDETRNKMSASQKGNTNAKR